VIIPAEMQEDSVSPEQMQQMIAMMTPQSVEFTPTEGQAIVAPSTKQEIIANLYPAADLNSITFRLPPDNASRVGQRVFVRSSRQITECTFLGDTTVDNASVMFVAGDSVVFIKASPTIWSRVV